MEHPLGACCVSGYIATGTPTGEMSTVGGVAAYLAKPKDGKSYEGRAVVIASDVFGLELVNTKLLADIYAEKGNFLVVIPDLFDGKPLPPALMDNILLLSGKGKQAETMFGRIWQNTGALATLIPQIIPFTMKHKEAAKFPILDKVIDDLKAQHNVTKIGMAGFCWGGMFCQVYGKTDKLSAIVIAHSRIQASELDQIKTPGLLICADNDMAFPEKERKKVEDILSKRTDTDFKMKFYPGSYHGFAVRGDETNEKIQQDKQDATKEAVDWFQKYLA